MLYSLLYSETDEKYRGLAENELEAIEFFIPERCLNSEINSISRAPDTSSNTKHYKKTRSFHEVKNKVRDSWRQSHIMPEKYESWNPSHEGTANPAVAEVASVEQAPPASTAEPPPPPSDL